MISPSTIRRNLSQKGLAQKHLSGFGDRLDAKVHMPLGMNGAQQSTAFRVHIDAEKIERHAQSVQEWLRSIQKCFDRQACEIQGASRTIFSGR